MRLPTLHRRMTFLVSVVAVLTALLLLTAALVTPTGANARPAGARTSSAGKPIPDVGTALRLECSAAIGSSRGTPVLLVPGTTLTPEQFRWNYMKVFNAQGRGWCAVTLPRNALGNIQRAGEIVAAAIAATHARAGRQIAVIGHSQGGMVPRWALKYFPDTRGMISDLVGLSPSNHGTLAAYPVCAAGCPPAFWQQQTTSAFLAALNRGAETYAGIDYTQVYTVTDEIVVPNLPTPSSLPVPSAASSELHTGAGRISNIPVQSICPTEIADHLSMGTSDPVGFAVAVDAIDQPGPADASRISRLVCLQGITPGIDPVTFPADFGSVVATAGQQAVTARRVPAEPPLRRYAR